MRTQFSQDLRVARRNAGFTQSDIAHLLKAHQSAVSDLETGHSQPSLEQLIGLSLIFGRSFESLYAAAMAKQRKSLQQQLKTLPELDKVTAHTFNRDGSLAKLEAYLVSEADNAGA